MIAAMYLIMAFGVFLAALFEGDKIRWAIVGGALWPLTLSRVLYLRMTGL